MIESMIIFASGPTGARRRCDRVRRLESAAEAFAPPYWANGRYESGKSRTRGHPAAIGAN